MSEFLKELAADPVMMILLGAGLLVWTIALVRRAFKGPAPLVQLTAWNMEWWEIFLYLLTATFWWFYVMVQMVWLTKLALALPDPVEGQPAAPELLVASHLGSGAGFLLGCWMHARIFRNRPVPPPTEERPLGWLGAFLRALPLYLAWIPVLVASSQFSSLLFPDAESQEALKQFPHASLAVKILLFAAAAVLAPLAEETLFRAGLYRQLKSRVGLTNAAALSALVFAGIHFYPYGFLPLFLFGLFLAYAYERHGSLKVPILLHAMNNGVSLILALVIEGALETVSHHPFSDIPSETVASLGERRLIDCLREWLGTVNPPAPAGMGDDCAAAPFKADGSMLVTVDSVVYGRHFDASVSPRRAGRELVNRNLSDIAAMGGVPDRAVVALMLPRRTRTDWLREFYLGLAEAAAVAGLSIVGGDITETTSDLSASLTLIGHAKRPLTRKGGRAGDLLAVTGALGGSILGRHADFPPRLAEGRWLAARGEVLTLMDVTDGLAKDLPELLPENTAAVLDLTRLPLHDDAHTLAARDGRSPQLHALADGEDYELVMALAAGTDPEAFLDAWRKEFPVVPLTVIGRIETAPAGTAGRLVNAADGLAVNVAGYSHLG